MRSSLLGLASQKLVRESVVVLLLATSCKSSDSRTTAPPPKTYSLTITIGKGVGGQPTQGRATYSEGQSVTYAFTALPGYSSVRVRLDGAQTSQAGSIAMTSDHMLGVTADSVMTPTTQEQSSITQARSLLTSTDPVRTYASLLQGEANLQSSIGEAAAAAQLSHAAAFAFDPVADSAALRRVDAALQGTVYDIEIDGASFSRGSVAPTDLPITIIYVNGILTDPEQAVLTKFWVRTTLAHAGLPDYQAGTYSVKLYYNATSGQRRGESAFCNLGVVQQSWLRHFGPFAILDAISSKCGAILDIARAATQVIDLLGAPIPDSDAQALARLINTERAQGRGVIVVGHSQGTLIAQQALKSLYGFDLSKDAAKCTSLISLAAPVPDVVPALHSKTFYVQGLATRDIMLSPLNVATRGYTGTATDTAAVTDSDLAFWNSLLPGFSDFKDLAFGIRLHSVDGSYLNASPIRAQIQQALRDQVATLRSDCHPAPVALQIVTQPGPAPAGSLLNPQPTVQLTDAAGLRAGTANNSVTASVIGISGALGGTRTVSALNGVARFTDLTISSAGTIRIQFASTGLTPVITDPITISQPQCAPPAVPLPFVRNGDFSSANCSSFGAPTIAVATSIGAQSALRLNASAASFTPFISVASSDGRQSEFISSTQYSFSPKWLLAQGGYVISLGNFSAPAGGAYQLGGSLESENVSTCEVMYVLQPRSITTAQSLGSGDCTDGYSYSDYFSTVGSGPCAVTMRSSTVDAYLQVFDYTGSLVAYDDDGAGGTDARISLANCYSGSSASTIHGLRFRATSYSSGETGAYTLTITYPQAAASSSQGMNDSSSMKQGDLNGVMPTLTAGRQPKQRPPGAPE